MINVLVLLALCLMTALLAIGSNQSCRSCTQTHAQEVYTRNLVLVGLVLVYLSRGVIEIEHMYQP